jgi:hypothetical protein
MLTALIYESQIDAGAIALGQHRPLIVTDRLAPRSRWIDLNEPLPGGWGRNGHHLNPSFLWHSMTHSQCGLIG